MKCARPLVFRFLCVLVSSFLRADENKYFITGYVLICYFIAFIR